MDSISDKYPHSVIHSPLFYRFAMLDLLIQDELYRSLSPYDKQLNKDPDTWEST